MQREPLRTQRLARSDDGYLAGVCEGVGRYFGVNANVIRLIWLVAVLGFGTGVLLYALLWWLMPRENELPLEPTIRVQRENGQRHPPLVRTVADRKVLGVCGGLARRWNLEPTLVRLGALSVVTVSGGLAAIAYLIAAIVIPSSETVRHRPHPVEL